MIIWVGAPFDDPKRPSVVHQQPRQIGFSLIAPAFPTASSFVFKAEGFDGSILLGSNFASLS